GERRRVGDALRIRCVPRRPAPGPLVGDQLREPGVVADRGEVLVVTRVLLQPRCGLDGRGEVLERFVRAAAQTLYAGEVVEAESVARVVLEHRARGGGGAFVVLLVVGPEERAH